MSAQDTETTTPPAVTEVIVGQKNVAKAPWNAVSLVFANADDRKAINFGSASIVRMVDGRLAAITAGHVVLDPKKKINGTASLMSVYPGTYGVKSDHPNDPNSSKTILSYSQFLIAKQCIVHDKFKAAPYDQLSVSWDIAILIFDKSATIKGDPLVWADAGGVLTTTPAAKVYSVTGHRDFGGADFDSLTKMRHSRVTRHTETVKNLITYLAPGTSLGKGMSGGPLLNVWFDKPDQARASSVYGHHVKSSSKETAKSPAPVTWFGGLKYTGEIADWLKKNGL
jgi:hypothetical protein